VIRVAFVTVLLFALVGIFSNVFDAAFHRVAVMTGDATWNTQSWAKDRFLNGIEITADYSSLSGTVDITVDNASLISQPKWNVLVRCGGKGAQDIDVVTSTSVVWDIPANSITQHTIYDRDLRTAELDGEFMCEIVA
jgi:hypothetical protein